MPIPSIEPPPNQSDSDFGVLDYFIFSLAALGIISSVLFIVSYKMYFMNKAYIKRPIGIHTTFIPQSDVSALPLLNRTKIDD
jgi:hypothetical protein